MEAWGIAGVVITVAYLVIMRVLAVRGHRADTEAVRRSFAERKPIADDYERKISDITSRANHTAQPPY